MKLKGESTPGAKATAVQVVDYLELLCLESGVASVEKVHRVRRSGGDDRDEQEGAEESIEEDKDIDAWIDEIERRQRICPHSYPFEVTTSGKAIRLLKPFSDRNRLLYNFCLLATRLNMRDQKVQAGIDGTQLFERISARISQAYVGPPATSIVFGAGSAEEGFQEKVNELCAFLQEGGHYVPIDDSGSDQKDGKLDVVTWKPFPDEAAGKIVFFGQCKTGTNWEDSVRHLHPDGFLRNWVYQPSIVSPIGRMFFVCDMIQPKKWKSKITHAGIIFDRLRLCAFEESLTRELCAEIRIWTHGACESAELPHLAALLCPRAAAEVA